MSETVTYLVVRCRKTPETEIEISDEDNSCDSAETLLDVTNIHAAVNSTLDQPTSLSGSAKEAMSR